MHGSSRLSRRQALQLFAIAGAGGALAACASPGGSSQTGSPTAAASGAVDGEISFAHWRAEDKDVIDKVIQGFVAEHPGAAVEQNISTSTDYQSTALQKIKGGGIGDVFTAFRGAQFTSMVEAGVFAPIVGTDLASKYIPSLLEAGASDKTQLGYPYQLVFNMPLSNGDLLEKVGYATPPADWDGFVDMLDKLKAQQVVPLIFPGGSAADYPQLINAMVMNNAPTDDMFTKIADGSSKCTDDWFITTLEQYAQLRPYVQEHAESTTAAAAQQLFASGGGALLVAGSYYVTVIRGLGAQFPIGLVAPITTSASEARWQGVHNATFILGVNAASEEQATAAAFVEYLSMPDVAGVYANGTNQFVTVEGVDYTSADLKALSPWLQANTILAPAFQFDNLDVRAAVQNATLAVISGTDPEAAAEAAQEIVDQNS